MRKKGSYFFVIDAFVAGIIILGAIVVMFGQFINETSTRPVFFSAEDLFSVMESTEIRNYDNSTVRDWLQNGTVNDSSRTILQQIAYFNATNRTGEAELLADSVLRGIPQSVGGEIFVGNRSYARKDLPGITDREVFFSGKRTVLVRESPTDILPPILIEVQTWQ